MNFKIYGNLDGQFNSSAMCDENFINQQQSLCANCRKMYLVISVTAFLLIKHPGTIAIHKSEKWHLGNKM